jgi:hypothetical protein
LATKVVSRLGLRYPIEQRSGDGARRIIGVADDECSDVACFQLVSAVEYVKRGIESEDRNQV